MKFERNLQNPKIFMTFLGKNRTEKEQIAKLAFQVAPKIVIKKWHLEI